MKSEDTSSSDLPMKCKLSNSLYKAVLLNQNKQDWYTCRTLNSKLSTIFGEAVIGCEKNS
jgi:hypothetical protein